MKNKNRVGRVLAVLAIVMITLLIKVNYAEAYTNYYGIDMTEDEYATLTNLGFSADDIYYMDLDTFNNNKDLDATLLVREVKHYKTVYSAYGIGYTIEISEEEFNNQDQGLLRDTQYTTYKTIVSVISQVGTRYRYMTSVVWNQMPEVRKYDIIGVGYEDFVHIYNSIVYFAYHYTAGSDPAVTSTQYYDRKITEYGSSVVYKVPDDNDLNGLSVSLFYDVEKDSGIGTITSLSLCGDYSHAISNSVTSTLAANHTISYGGIGLFGNNINLYDAIPCTYANAIVSW